jgi:hypothetical protein
MSLLGSAGLALNRTGIVGEQPVGNWHLLSQTTWASAPRYWKPNTFTVVECSASIHEEFISDARGSHQSDNTDVFRQGHLFPPAKNEGTHEFNPR